LKQAHPARHTPKIWILIMALHPFFEKTRIFPQPRAADPD
jgi:hypothetical protein